MVLLRRGSLPFWWPDLPSDQSGLVRLCAVVSRGIAWVKANERDGEAETK